MVGCPLSRTVRSKYDVRRRPCDPLTGGNSPIIYADLTPNYHILVWNGRLDTLDCPLDVFSWLAGSWHLWFVVRWGCRIPDIPTSLNPFTTGNPFLGTKLLGFSIGRGSGALKGLTKLAPLNASWGLCGVFQAIVCMVVPIKGLEILQQCFRRGVRDFRVVMIRPAGRARRFSNLTGSYHPDETPTRLDLREVTWSKAY